MTQLWCLRREREIAPVAMEVVLAYEEARGVVKFSGKSEFLFAAHLHPTLHVVAGNMVLLSLIKQG